MKMEIGEEWCMRMAQLEGDAEIGAGLLAIDPVGETASVAASEGAAFGRFLSLMRRRRGLGFEKPADDADVE